MGSNTLLIGNDKEIRIINIQTILYVKVDDYLSTFHLPDNQKSVCAKPMFEIAECLPDHFFQISRSCVVNLNEISLVKRKMRMIILSNGTELTVSARRMQDLHIALARLNSTFTR